MDVLVVDSDKILYVSLIWLEVFSIFNVIYSNITLEVLVLDSDNIL